MAIALTQLGIITCIFKQLEIPVPMFPQTSRYRYFFLCVYIWTCLFPGGWMHPHSAYLPMLLFQDYLMAAKVNSLNRKMSGLASFKACLWHTS